MPSVQSPTARHYIKKYLERYAEPEVAVDLGSLPVWDEFVGIPLFDEHLLFADTATALDCAAAEAQKKVVAVLVVNCPTHASEGAKQRTLTHLEELKQAGKELAKGITLKKWSGAVDFMVVDRVRQEIPKKQGVGLARKIAFDIGSSLFFQEKILSPWARSLDADSRPARDYFLTPPPETSVAVLYPYRHVPASDPLVTQATYDYELHLRYYEKMLSLAGSPFAYTALGSSLAVHFEAYAKVRGWPKRSAAEDFYLLNKLRPLGNFHRPSMAAIEIKSRLSNRVPFGTGRSTEIRHASLQRGESPRLYHPRAFALLQALLELFERLVTHRDPIRFGDDFFALDANLSVPLRSIWNDFAFEEGIRQALQTRPTPIPLQYHLQEWFDGLKTLQFIRKLHQEGLTELPVSEALLQSGLSAGTLLQTPECINKNPNV